jgi:hypothetical protein
MKTLAATLALLCFAGPAFAAGKATTKKPAASATPKKATGVNDDSVAAAVNAFVDALNSLDEAKVLDSVTPADRLALMGHDQLIGIVNPRKLINPTVKAWEKVEKDGKLLGAKATISLEEVDPIDGTKVPKERNWALALDGNVLKVSISSVWLDAGRLKGEDGDSGVPVP